jgi:hypothetical protein
MAVSQRGEFERDDVARVVGVRIQALLQCVLRPQLGVVVGHADTDRRRLTVVEEHPGRRDVRLLQQVLHAIHHRQIDLDRGLAARDLHRGRLTEEVRQRVKEADRQRDDDDDVLPGRVSIHGFRPRSRALRSP